MLNNFFELNSGFQEFDSDQMDQQLRASKHIVNVLYRPDDFSENKVEGVKFENVSFAKTTITKCTFKGCIFEDCLFIGSVFDGVEFHECNFINCNFFKAKLSNVYAKPRQFLGAIKDRKYANIAVHLYQQLRENYSDESQREFKNEAEYYFSKWRRKLYVSESKRNDIPWYRYAIPAMVSFLYDVFFGYGYRLRNLAASTALVVTALVIVNQQFARYLFSHTEHPSLIKSIYFTITTMSTLGASGYSPLTQAGYLAVTIEVLLGITLFTATVNSILRKVVR